MTIEQMSLAACEEKHGFGELRAGALGVRIAVTPAEVEAFAAGPVTLALVAHEIANAEATRLSLTDALTGLGNRRRMEEDLASAHSRASFDAMTRSRISR